MTKCNPIHRFWENSKNPKDGTTIFGSGCLFRNVRLTGFHKLYEIVSFSDACTRIK